MTPDNVTTHRPDQEYRDLVSRLAVVDREVAGIATRLAWSSDPTSRPISRDLTTGLPNRRSLHRYLTATLPGGFRGGTGVWCAVLRLESTAAVAGRAAIPAEVSPAQRQRWLRALGQELTDLVGQDGMVGRWSSDEIAVLLPADRGATRDAVLDRILDLERRLPAELLLEPATGLLDVVRLHTSRVDLSAALAHCDTTF
jgi:GGDEF domain-containing protein